MVKRFKIQAFIDGAWLDLSQGSREYARGYAACYRASSCNDVRIIDHSGIEQGVK